MDIVNIREKFSLVDEYWHPKIIGELNGQLVKIAKVKGEFIWHDHKEEDELFYVVQGELRIDFRNSSCTLKEGEMMVVPKGTEHKPVAGEETWLLLFEPGSTRHTGDVVSDRTVNNQERI